MYAKVGLIFLLPVAMGLCSLVQAAVTVVAASPSSRSVPLGRPVSVSFAWIATTDTHNNVTVSSSHGVFLTPTALDLGTVERPMSKTISGPATAPIRESVVIPASVIYQTYKAGFDKLIYQRSFNDGDGSETGQITLHITSSEAAEFTISRLALQFDDGSPLRVVPSNDRLQVQANIRFVGSGFFKATWELAGPGSMKDAPDYVPLRAVRHYLTGSEPIALTSPDLPTDAAGQYRIRLRISDPQPEFDPPVIRYLVAAGKG